MSAEENAKKIPTTPLFAAFREADKIKDRDESKMKKYFRLVEVQDKIAALIAPHTPCKDKCSHCCNMAVVITDTEAKLISEHIGKSYVKQKYPKSMILRHTEMLKKYTLVPCVFLHNDSCSIYEVRPLACRGHHSLDDDNTACDIRYRRNTPSLELMPIERAYAQVFMSDPWGDIREYFPE